MKADVAIVGMACRFPHARDLNALWKLLLDGEVTFEDIPNDRWNHATFYEPNDVRAADKTYVRKGAFIEGIKEFAALHYGLAPRRVQVTDPQHRLLVEMSRQALQDAGYEKREFDKANTGVYVGISSNEFRDILSSRIRAQQMADGTFGAGGDSALVDAMARATADVAPMRAFSIAGNLLNMAACTVSQTFDLGGPSFALDTACSSALVAIHQAALQLRTKECNLALAGGVYLNLMPDNLIGFSRIGAVSPSGACRPFDSKADGFVMGEGVGVVVLKRLEDAQRDGDRIYAVLKGSGCNNDARGEGPMTPRPEGQLAAMNRAWDGLDFDVDSIGLVETHGTATAVGDVVEVGALKEFFAHRAKPGTAQHAHLSSIKANIGHTMSAAGVAGFIKAALAVHHGVIPPQPGIEELNPKLDLENSPFRIAREQREWLGNGAPRRAAISSFGFGGTNAHAVIEEAPASVEKRHAAVKVAAEKPELFLFSAGNASLFPRHLREVADAVERENRSCAEVSQTLTGRTGLAARLSFVATGREELLATLRACADALELNGSLPKSVQFQAAPVPEESRKIAFLFPGQGAQRIGLLKDMVERFPRLKARMAELDTAAKKDAGTSILEALYPAAPYDAAAAQAKLTRTEVCQPAMAALGVALAETLARAGVKPDVVLGHSLGEFAAAASAGMLTGESAVSLVAARGQVMNRMGLADNGAMLAVMAPRARVAELLSGTPDVWDANLNHPQQVVVSGTTPGIKAAQEKLTAAGVKTTALDVSHAFHSPLMQGVDAGMRSLIAPLKVHAASVPVASCITGATYGSADEAREVWVRHATAPVDFVSALETCLEQGARIFVQVGAGGTLLSFARGVATEGCTFLSLGQTEQCDGGAQFLATLGHLFTLGVDVDATALLPQGARTVAPLPPSPLETETYWPIEKTERPVQKLAVRAQQVEARPSFTGAPMDNSLIALFREQTALLQSHADIIRAQTQALAGIAPEAVQSRPMTLAPAAFPVAPAATPKPPNFSNLIAAKPAPTSAATTPVSIAAPQVEVREKVLASVARISAFPVGALKLDQTLVGDLGFDSLMLVELDGDIGKAWPTLGGLPRELFSKNTTITSIIDHVSKTLAGGVPAAAAKPAESKPAGPVSRYLPTVTPAPLKPITESVVRFDLPLLVTTDTLGVGTKVAEMLQAAGIQATLGTADTKGDFSGVIYTQALGGSADWKAPTKALLGLGKRFAEKGQAFVTVTGLGGRFGFDGTARAGLGQVGALALTRALSQEWPEALVKAIDVDAALPVETIARAVVDELRGTDATCEVGYSKAGRAVTTLVPLDQVKAAAPLTADAVVLVTGGAKGVGLKLAKAMAKAYGCALVLTGRGAATDETAKSIALLKSAGARAVSYEAMDVRDAASVKRGADAAMKAHGRIDAVVHAAGVLADALVQKKDLAAADDVLETKVGGALALEAAIPGAKLWAYIGSWAGRFGNAAQTDYSAANAMMSALTHSNPSTGSGRAGARRVAIDFPPWEDSSMAKKIPGFLKAQMIAAGVTFLSDEEGTQSFLAALAADSGEVLVGRAMPERVATARAEFPLTRLNHVYLNDHQMNGQRVLPLAAAADLATAAALDSLPARPAAFSLEHFRLQRPVLVADTVWLESEAKFTVKDGKPGDVAVSLRQGSALAYSGVVKAFTGKAPAAPAAMTGSAAPMSVKDFYAGFTFHGPRLQGIVTIDALSETGVTGTVKGSTPAEWIKEPLRKEWAIDPLIIDASFQLAGYWAWVKHQRAGFPIGFSRFTQFAPFGKGPVRCTAHFQAAEGDVFRGTLTWQAEDGHVLAVMEGAEAEFKKRDPQFTAKAPAAEAKVAETAAPAGYKADPSSYDPALFPEYVELKERIGFAEAFGLKNPYFSVHEAICGDTTVVGGKTMINFSSYNYVGNSGDAYVTEQSKKAIEKYGTSVSASRVASGEKPLHKELEEGLARFFGTEDCIVFTSGHATNVTVIGHVVGAGDLILHDALAHDSIIQGAKLSGAKRRPFPHNDWEALDRALEQLRPHYRRVLICIEGTYSMDGDIPDLPKFIEVKKKHQALLFVDEAHSAGVIGKTGRGIGEYHDVVRGDVDMWMGTMSKSFASCGGWICASHALVEYLKYTTPGFVYSVGLSPPGAAAALASLHQLEKHPDRVTKCQKNSKRFLELLKERGIDTGMSRDSAVVPAIVGNSMMALQLSDRLKDRGVNVQPILYPAVEEHLARLRFFLSSLHTDEQLVTSANILKEEFEKLKREHAADAVA